MFSLCFGFDSALKTVDAQLFFWSVFFKMHKKLLAVKNAFWLFLAISNFLLVH